MKYSDEKLNKIYDKRNGYCSFCEIKLSFNNYGHKDICARGAWEVDHGNPESLGGVNDLRNLQPSCSLCNRRKGNMTTAQFKKLIKEYSSPQNFHKALRRKYCS